jgi:hypothetical protein
VSIEYNVMHVVWVQEGDECKEVEQLAFKSWVSLRQARDRYFRFSALEMCQAYLVERDVSGPRRSTEALVGFLPPNSQNRRTATAYWASTLFATVGCDRAKSVYRAMTRVLHPDNPETGDDAMWRELNDAFKKYEEGSK